MKAAAAPRVRISSLLIYALLWAALLACGLSLADMIEGFNPLEAIVFSLLGLTAGWLLAQTRMKIRAAAPLAILAGILFELAFLGGALRPAGTVYTSLARLELSALNALIQRGPQPVDPAAFLNALQDLGSYFFILGSRLSAWFTGASAGFQAFDPLITALIWSLVVWTLSAWAGWAARRMESPLAAILPAGILLAGNLNYVRTNPYFILPLLAAGILLVIITGQLRRERYWERAGFDYSDEIRIDLSIAAVPLTLLILALAVISPSISIRDMVEWARRTAERPAESVSQVGESLGLKPDAGETDYMREYFGGGLPRLHLLGSGPELSQIPVLAVSVDGVNPLPGGTQVNVPSYYWRSLVYDYYNGHGWMTSGFATFPYASGSILIDPQKLPQLYPRRKTVVQHVRKLESGDTLAYHTGDLLQTENPIRVSWRSAPEPWLDEFGAIVESSSYTVQSLEQEASVEELRNAGRVYPQWVLERYLQLPENLPARIRNLALDLISAQSTPYDQAVAIQDYLHTLPYNLELPAPPGNQDVVDYFLFDLRQGYCDYFASAMAVMARAAGMPSRVVIGYAPGTFNPQSGEYIVTDAEAHSWVEIYFPTYGWVEFEPTPGRPGFARSDLAPAVPPAPPSPAASTSSTWKGALRLAGLVLVALAASAGVFASFISSIDRLRLRRLPAAQAVETLYKRFRVRARRLEEQPFPGETPLERLRALTVRLRSIATRRDAGSTEGDLSRMEQLTALYQRAAYSPHPVLPEEREHAIDLWSRLRRRLLWARVRLNLMRVWMGIRKNLTTETQRHREEQ